jgi:SAM-dependent methyltransferase
MSGNCNICGHTALEKIYVLDDKSVNSLMTYDARHTDVWFCSGCGHTMTTPLADLGAFYGEDYHIHANSEEEDQLLKIIDGKKIFRSDLQAETLMQKIGFAEGMRVLDFGCAKAATLKKVMKQHAIVPFVFDVSHHYQTFWDGYFAKDHQAIGDLPDSWLGSMDVVCSFFCIEHVADPGGILKTKYSLLKEGGTVYFVIPNLRKNVADLLVLDHINHFAPCSLRYAMEQAGFSNIMLDESVNDGWFVVTAVRREAAAPAPAVPTQSDIAAAGQVSKTIAGDWKRVTDNISSYRVPGNVPIAIYGAGFYGSYTLLHLDPSVQVACFVDQNTFLQGSEHMGKIVVAPETLAADITHVLVAINPVHAKAAMESIVAWKDRAITYEFIYG